MESPKKFKHRSHQASLKDVHLPAPHSAKRKDDTVAQFHPTLELQRQLCLTSAFTTFADKVQGISISLPLLVLNAHDVVDAWIEATRTADDESLKSLLHLFPPLLDDLRTTLLSSYDSLLDTLLFVLQPKTSTGALTNLLIAFSSLFKHLLVPQKDANTILSTWEKLCRPPPRFHSEIRRAIAEVWAATIRRLGSPIRHTAILAVIQCPSDDVAAWTLISSCKSVAHTLHSSTSSFIHPLLDYHAQNGDNSSYTLTRRVLTALAHHVKDAEGYEPISSLVTSLLSTPTESPPEMDRLLQILHIPLAVRQGARMTPSHLETLLLNTLSLMKDRSSFLTQLDQDGLVQFLTALVTSPLPPSMTSSTMNLMDLSFSPTLANNDLTLGLRLTETIAQLHFPLFKPVILPSFLRHVSQHPKVPSCISVLAGLARSGRLVSGESGHLTDIWQTRVREHLLSLLELPPEGDANAAANGIDWKDIFTLLPLCRGSTETGTDRVEELIKQRIDALLDAGPSPDESDRAAMLGTYLSALCRFHSSGRNGPMPEPIAGKKRPRHSRAGSSLGSILEVEARLQKDKSADSTQPGAKMLDCLPSWILSVTTHWAAHDQVLSGLADLCQTFNKESLQACDPLSFEGVWTPALRDQLLSSKRTTRLSVLRIINFVISLPSQRIESSLKEIVKRCVAGEEVSLDVAGVRERVLRIGRVPQVVPSSESLGDAPSPGVDLCCRWLISQLKISLRPLWSPASGALASLASSSSKNAEVVWSLLWKQLQEAATSQKVSAEDSEKLDTSMGAPVGDYETEKTWRDPAAHQVRVAVRSRLCASTSRSVSLEDRSDAKTFEGQLLSTLSETSLAEKHNRLIVPFFLSLCDFSQPSRLPMARSRLQMYLTLFANFANPKAIHSTETLRTLYHNLLSHSDRSIQSAALTCYLSYHPASSELRSKEEPILRGLLDDVRFRDTLSTIDLTDYDEELVDVIMRLAYGVMLRDSNRKAAVLGLFAGAPNQHQLELVVRLMLLPITEKWQNEELVGDATWSLHDIHSISEKQQVGYLNLLGDVLYNFGSRLVPLWPIMLGTTIDMVARAHRLIEKSKDSPNTSEDDDAVEDNEGQSSDRQVSMKALRSVRQLGIKRIAQFVRLPTPDSVFDFRPFLRAAFPAFISPRLPHLAKENSQAPSALIDLLASFMARRDFVLYLVTFDDTVLPNLFACLSSKNVKPSVVGTILDTLERLLAYSAEDEEIKDKVLLPSTPDFLSHMATFLASSHESSVHEHRQIQVLSQIAEFASSPDQASTLVLLLLPRLSKPLKQVPEKVKTDLLRVVYQLIPQVNDLSSSTSTLFTRVFNTLSKLFSHLRSRPARLALVETFRRVAQKSEDAALVRLSGVLESLNAYSTKRIDDPDFERRLEAFRLLTSHTELTASLSTECWQPLLHDMFHCIQDTSEISLRANAAGILKHFVSLVGEQGSESPIDSLFTRVFLPCFKNALRSRNELVRTDLLSVLSVAVQHCIHHEMLQDLRPLLADGDDEANVFNNLYHLQNHRRSRALRRLGEFVRNAPSLRSSTVKDIFFPLISNYISSPSLVDHHLVTDAIHCLGDLSFKLSWKSYHGLIQDYLKLVRTKDDSEKVHVRALVAILDNFHFDISHQTDGNAQSVLEDETGDVDERSREDLVIADAINLSLLPSLLKHLETHDENTDDTARIPLAIGIASLASRLPTNQGDAQIRRLLTILSQILRSHSQETRDLVRDSLQRITSSLGPRYLPYVLSELRHALVRGPQLHILAYTVHHLLVHITEDHQPTAFNQLDSCIEDILHASSEVVFGESGKDVQAEGFKTKLREVKASASKGLDCFTLVARYISPTSLRQLLLPVRSIMHETESISVMRVVDEVLRRIALGLNSSKLLSPCDLLSFCHTLIVGNAEFLRGTAKPQQEEASDPAIVQTKRTSVLVDHYSKNSFRFVVLGLDLLSTGLKRGTFDTTDKEILSRLQTLLVDVGNALYASNTPVIILALKCSASLCRCPLPKIERSLTLIVKETITIIRKTGNTETEVVQAAFKSLSVILRDGPPVEVKEKDIIYLLEIVAPDLEDVDRQSAVFSLLRAIVARKFIVPEIYELMQNVSTIMVTSQSPQVQEMCRSVLLQFFLDYPQGKGRLRNQVTFLVNNLSYAYESGRMSVLEILRALVSKLQVGLVEEHSDLIFVGLVMVIANDSTSKCREMAASLIKTLFIRVGDETKSAIMGHCTSWASQSGQPQLRRVSFQLYGLLVDVAKEEDLTSHLDKMVRDLRAALETSSSQLASLEENDAMDLDLPWEVAYHSLTAIFKVHSTYSRRMNDDNRNNKNSFWHLATSHLLYPHAWVRTSACRLLGHYFSIAGVISPMDDRHPLSLDEMVDIAQKLSSQLKSEHLDETLSLQIVKNLFHIGKCFCLVVSAAPADADGVSDDEDSEDGDDGREEHAEGKMVAVENPLAWLFSKLSYQLKSAHIMRTSKSTFSANWDIQALAILRWFAAMANHMEGERVQRFLVHMLTPMNRFIEDETIKDEKIDGVKGLCIELQSLIEGKVGAGPLAEAYSQIRRGLLEFQRQRKIKRAVQATTNPEVAAKRKMHRNSLKKDSRKRKNTMFAEKNGRFKRTKIV